MICLLLTDIALYRIGTTPDLRMTDLARVVHCDSAAILNTTLFGIATLVPVPHFLPDRYCPLVL